MKGFIGEIWNFKASRKDLPPDQSFECFPSGALIVSDSGTIVALGDSNSLKAKYPKIVWKDFGDKLILPGFVDTHVHFPQVNLIGRMGEPLLGWLNRYTFPEESRFREAKYAEKMSKRFISQLLAHGTTTACIFSSSHAEATQILLEALDKSGMRAVVGKTSMDRNAPADLLTPWRDDLKQTEGLVSKWNGRNGKLFYALTPRFAVSCSDEMLKGLGEFHKAHPELRIQTHYSESPDELTEVKALFPKAQDYLSVYEESGLINRNTILAHSLHPSPSEWDRLGKAQAALSHCPTSNLFLGSGLFAWKQARARNLRVGLGSDVGGGTSFSLLRTMDEAHKVQKLLGEMISGYELLYAATLGGAESLGLEKVSGNFAVGKSADFQILDPALHPLLSTMWEKESCPSDRLSALIHLGDDRLVQDVFIQGSSAAAHKA